MNVEIAYVGSPPDGDEYLLTLEVATGCTVKAAVEQSNILTKCPEIPWPDCKIGIFGRLVDKSYVLQEGDRIEIYRPLTIDPKERRRKR